MPKKGEKLSDEQKAKMAAGRTKTKTPSQNILAQDSKPSEANQDLAALQRQVAELTSAFTQSQALNQAFLAGSQSNSQQSGPQFNRGKLVGTVEKYAVDSSRYPDPRDRLASESRLSRFAFKENYDLNWDISVASYETKDGINTKEPKFKLSLSSIRRDEFGDPTDQRIKLRELVFFEDPQTAIVVANDNGLSIDDSNELDFLNEMRYLRMRDWLLESFYPKKPTFAGGIKQEVIGGKLVEIYEVNTAADKTARIPFDQLSTKVS